MTQIDQDSINWLENGEKAEAIILNRPIKELLQKTNSALSTIDSSANNKFQTLENRLNAKVNKPTISTTGTRLDWKTVFECSSIVSAPTGDTIAEEEWTLYQSGAVVRTIIKTADFNKVQFSLTDMKEGTDYTLKVRQRGTNYGWSEQSNAFAFKTADIFDKIYGVALLAEGGNGGTLAHVDIEGNIIKLSKTDFDAHPIWGKMEDQVVDGQHMVKVPKFYTKFENKVVTGPGAPSTEVPVRYISDKPLESFEAYPAFFDAGEEVDQFWYGKYQATVDETKMCSVPGVLPTVETSLNQFKAAAEERNVDGVDGFMVLSWYQVSAIQWLYLIENATFNSQAKTGQGRVNASSAANVDAPDVAQATYRGIVGLWGNVHDWIDGFIWNPTTGIRVWDRLGNKSWVETGKFYTLPLDSYQYPLTHMEETGVDFDLSDGFIGETGSANISTGTVPDSNYFGKIAQDNAPHVGGYYDHSTLAGLWAFIVINPATHTRVHLGSRLAKV